MENASNPTEEKFRFSRRSFLAGLGATGASAALPASLLPAARARTGDGPLFGAGLHEVTLQVNGRKRELSVETRTTLLDALRDRLDLTGAKKICDRGACGGCTVLVDGECVNSCMMLALDAEGSAIRTVEGLAEGGELHPVQAAFVEKDALQCGFCTPGFVMASVACLEKHPAPDRDCIREELAGNLCRCGTYTRIFEAVELAASRRGGR